LTINGAASIVDYVTEKSRLDTLLVQRGLVKSPEKARAVVLAGAVMVDDRPAPKPGALVSSGSRVRLLSRPQYVSRGGEKLAHALSVFGIDVSGLTVVDVGASTGGFTDCLLQRGAHRVYAIDVGYGLLDYRLRQDARVVVMERVNIRHLESLPAGETGRAERADLATIDVSFISLEKVIPAVTLMLKAGARIVALVKPQFEARRREVGKGGVVRDASVHAAVLGRLIAWCARRGLRLLGLTTSPLLGPAGNKEFLLLLGLAADAEAPKAGDL
jgi:23S rRNA (cytidine1920-2'-O)/16S rRNA (cytidine1409-2'-O)-methyltransferase